MSIKLKQFIRNVPEEEVASFDETGYLIFFVNPMVKRNCEFINIFLFAIIKFILQYS